MDVDAGALERAISKEHRSPRVIEVQLRELRVMSLRKAGLSYDEVADAMEKRHGDPMTGRAVAGLIARVLRRYSAQAAETMEILRRLELERLEQATIVVAQRLQAMGKPRDDKGHVSWDASVIREWVRLSESKRKLLGLDLDASEAPDTPGTGVGQFGIGGPQTIVVHTVPMSEEPPDDDDGPPGVDEAQDAAEDVEQGE